MILANIEAQIEAKKVEIKLNRNEIMKLSAVIESIKSQQKRLLEKDTHLYYELEELKDLLAEEKENIGL